jgi:hypothetical protein
MDRLCYHLALGPLVWECPLQNIKGSKLVSCGLDEFICLRVEPYDIHLVKCCQKATTRAKDIGPHTLGCEVLGLHTCARLELQGPNGLGRENLKASRSVRH